MGFHSWVFVHEITGSRGSCWNARSLGRGLELLPRDIANANALKQACMIVFLIFYMIP